VQVWTEASDLREAWLNFLGRPFHGMESAFYKRPFEEEIEDAYLRQAALRSLTQAGNDQELCYDFSFSSANIEKRGPQPGDLGVLVLVDEELEELRNPASRIRQFLELCRARQVRVALVTISGARQAAELRNAGGVVGPVDLLVCLECNDTGTPSPCEGRSR